jgi:tetratricopeptide (TPR) repeat protein
MGEVCHIKAKSPDGPRYDAEQMDEERHGFGNLVLLCPTHHARVDGNPDRYTVEKLLEIKAQHEARYAGGAEPSDAIARQFLHLDVELRGRIEITHTVKAPTPSSLYQLPADLADFTGREEEVRKLVALLGEGAAGATISAIGGMGGVGKTALAVHVAHKVATQYPDGQIVVEMGGTAERPLTPVEAMGQVVHAFQPELRLPDDANEVTALYRTTLEGRKALLLLDNAANSAQVRPLVVPAGCGLVVTSRHNISLPGLRHFDLDALPVEEACALLQTIVGQERATGEELGTIVKLCGRLPLALRVAGDFLVVHPDWSAAEYAQALADERKRLARLKHEDLDVGAALGLSAAQLVRERADLAARWQMLSVFPAPFERAAAAAAWGMEEGEAREGLSELAARSLVLYERESGLYRLHDLMRLVAEDAFGYGGGERDVKGERERLGEAAMRHAVYYLAMGSRADDVYMQGGEHVLEGLQLFDEAWPHLWAAYGRMRERGDRAAAQWTSEFPGRVPYVLDLRLPPRDSIPILEAAATAAHQIGERGTEGVRLGNLGIAYGKLGEMRRAIGTFEQALAIAREIGNRRAQGAILGNLANAYRHLGEARRAIEYHEQALAISRETGDRRGEGQDLGNLGSAYFALGETRRAIE